MLPWRAFGGSTAPPTPRFGPPASRTMKKSILLFADTKCAIICYTSPRDLTQPPRPQFTRGAAPRGPHLPIPPRLTCRVAPGTRTSRSPLGSHGAAPGARTSRSPLGSQAGRPPGPTTPDPPLAHMRGGPRGLHLLASGSSPIPQVLPCYAELSSPRDPHAGPPTLEITHMGEVLLLGQAPPRCQQREVPADAARHHNAVLSLLRGPDGAPTPPLAAAVTARDTPPPYTPHVLQRNPISRVSVKLIRGKQLGQGLPHREHSVT